MSDLASEINALPERLRRYIHDIDRMMVLHEENDEENERLRATIAALRVALELLLLPFQGAYRDGDPPERMLPRQLRVGDLLQASRALAGVKEERT